MVIRQMGAADLNQVAELEQLAFSHPWSRQSLEESCQAKHNIYLAAETGGKVVGYCCVGCSFENAELCRIAVDPKYRRQGAASALLEDAMARCRSRLVEVLFLEVRASNQAAIEMYKKFYFRQIHVRKGYYADPVEDAIIMQCHL